jgi:23S rRNA (guanosine2251-2'-O)-methyltransferase
MSRKASHHQAGGKVWIYGKHSVLAALNNPARDVARLMATKSIASELKTLLPQNVEISDEAKITAMVGRDAVHQGIAVQVSELKEMDLREIDLGNLVVLLDQVTDPHNVGAVLRSASAFGAAAVITTERNSPAQTGVLAKAASGALEYVSYIRVGNLTDAINYLKKQNFWVAGLDGESDKPVSEIAGYEKLALVLGAEGKGMRHKTREYCDFLVKIPMEARQESLNVSNAAAIALWEASKR